MLAENLKNERIANVFEDCESTREVRNNPVSKRSKISFDPNVIVLHRENRGEKRNLSLGFAVLYIHN